MLGISRCFPALGKLGAMAEQKQYFDWGFWFQWIVATTMGWIIGQVLLPGLALVTTGLGISLLQYLILMHRIRQPVRWPLGSTIGWTLGGLVVLLFIPVELEILAGPIFGAATGLAQWIVLRRDVHWAGWWIPISTLAWTTGLSILPGILMSGMMAAVLTGIALEILLRHPKDTTPETRLKHRRG